MQSCCCKLYSKLCAFISGLPKTKSSKCIQYNVSNSELDTRALVTKFLHCTWFLWSGEVGESRGILHSKVRENSEGRVKSGNLKVLGCKS